MLFSAIQVPEYASAVVRKSTRQTNPLGYLVNYDCPLLPKSSSINYCCLYLLSYVLSYNHLSTNHKNFLLAISTHDEPKSFTQASKFPHWVKTMEEEFAALQ